MQGILDGAAVQDICASVERVEYVSNTHRICVEGERYDTIGAREEWSDGER